MHFGGPEELENPPFGHYMDGPPTEVPALQETAPNVQFIQGRGRASEGRVNISPAMENQ
jgi:hypothetical protein